VLALVVAVYATNRVFYQDTGLPENDQTWLVKDRVHVDEVLQVRLALFQRNLDKLEAEFWAVSTPGNPKYHQYWTAQEVQQLVSPPVAIQQRVVSWALQSGCTQATSHGDWVAIECSAHVLETMLDTQLFWVEDLISNEIVAKIPSGSYSLPVGIAQHVEFVQTLGMFIHKHRMTSSRPRYESPSEDKVVPLTLYTIYNISYTIGSPKSTQNVAEFSSTGYLPSDLTTYSTQQGLQQPNPVTTVGPFKSSPPNVECTLDIEMITAIGLNGTNFFWTVSGWVLEFAEDLITYDDPPLVNSISWSADERSEGQQYNFRVDAEWQKLGTMGVSVLAASGDDGAVGESTCTGHKNVFNPGYPATSPYVTSVGATMLIGTPTTTTTPPICAGREWVCALSGNEDPADENRGGYATGGGFSVYEPRPSYQNTAVSAYLNDASIPKPPASYYNSSNRGFPDVAANGYNFLILHNGSWEPVGGTSAATPLWGGIYAIMNDYLIRNGKQPIGFANPLLYQIWADYPAAFTNIGDLTTNNDDGCTYGYTSNPDGWDPVTGLGAPNVGKLLQYLENNLNSFP